MSLVINHNMMAANVARNLNNHYGNLATSTERLASGLRINSAADDAAGLAIRELQRADIATLQQGARNANDAISMIQTADGALQVIDDQLIRMKELAEQAATGTYDSTQRLMIESEYQAIASEITRIANATDFNGIHLLNGTLEGNHDGSELLSTGAMKVHFGTANDSAEDYYYIQIGDSTAGALGVGNEAPSLVDNPSRDFLTKIAEESAEAVYQSTYDTEYDSVYNDKFIELTSATAEVPAIPEEEAAKLAAAEATIAATKAAEIDRDMAVASFEALYDTAYATSYAQSYSDSIAAGMGDLEAKALAQETATQAATADVIAKSNEAYLTNDLTALDMPSKYSPEAASVYAEQMGKQAYDAVYEDVYNDLMADAEGVIGANAVLAGTLTENEATALHNAVHAQATAIAMKVVEPVTELFQAEYDGFYVNGDGTGTGTDLGFKGIYDSLIAGEYGGVPAVALPDPFAALNDPDTGLAPALPEEAALVVAKQLAGQYAWDEMVAINDPLVSLAIPAADLTADLSINIRGVAVAGTFAVVPADVDTAVTAAATAYDANSGLLGSTQGMASTAQDFVEAAYDLPAGGTVSTQEAAQKSLEAINEAIVSKDKIRAHLGALQNRMESTINNLEVQAENMQAAESRISDVDVATEMTEFVRNQILTQSAVAMLSQANSLPKMAQQLLGG